MDASERALIVSALIDPQVVTQVTVRPDNFGSDQGGAIWQAMIQLLAAGSPIDGVTLQDTLKQNPRALHALGEAMSETASPANAEAYASQIIEASRRREVQAIAKDTLKESESGDVDAVAGQAISQLVGITAGAKNVDHSAQGLMAKTLEIIDRASGGEQLGVRAGYSQIDRKLGGWHRGDLIVVGARPSMGKSAFALTSALNAARAGARVGVVSTEMDATAIGMRLASSVAGIPIHEARCGRVSDEGWRKIAKASNDIAALPLRLLEAPGWTMGQIVRQCHAWHTTGIDMVIIDYLQRIKADHPAERRDLTIGQMAQEAKTLAATLSIPVMLLAQLSRSVEQRDDKRPRMSDLRDSGEIEQEADDILMLYRDSVYNDMADERAAEILIEKNRQGPVGKITMAWKGETAEWIDPDMRDLEAVA